MALYRLENNTDRENKEIEGTVNFNIPSEIAPA